MLFAVFIAPAKVIFNIKKQLLCPYNIVLITGFLYIINKQIMMYLRQRAFLK